MSYLKGFYLVLASSNLDESLRGFLTKYDCSSADINPISSLTKNDLRKILLFTYEKYGIEPIPLILDAQATPELQPTSGLIQSSIQQMELDYDELETFGKLRKIHRLGPVSMYRRLLIMWNHLSPTEVATKVKKFFIYYAQNRHKTVVATPSFHAEVLHMSNNVIRATPMTTTAST